MLFFALNRCNFVRSQYNEERQIGIEFLGNTCAIYKDQFSDQRMFMQRFHYILNIILPVSKVINSIPLSPLNVSQMLNALDQSGHFQILIISPVKKQCRKISTSERNIWDFFVLQNNWRTIWHYIRFILQQGLVGNLQAPNLLKINLSF